MRGFNGQPVEEREPLKRRGLEMIKTLTVFCILFGFCGVFAQSYVPLTKNDKKAFVQSAGAVLTAVEEKNYDGVVRFAPGILQQYESILLDPQSKNLRVLYANVKAALEDVNRLQAVDTFEVSINRMLEKGDFYVVMKKYDDYFDYLAGRGDSVPELHRASYRDCMVRYFDGGFESLKSLLVLRHADKGVLDSLQRVVEVAYRDVFVMATSGNDIQQLFDFQVKYPGLFVEDVENMIANFKARWRLSLKRRPKIERIEEYYAVFSGRDKMVDSLYQKLLYDDFKKNMDVETASKYLTHFPNGSNFREVRLFLEMRQEEEQLARLRRMQAVTQSLPATEEN
jgi:hypothetical protein